MIILGIFLILLSISLHELGHALVMRKYGIELQEICLLGLGGPILFSFKLPSIFKDTPLTIRAYLFGAFVKPTDFGSKRMSLLPIAKANHIYGAGIAMNLLFSAFLLCIYCIAKGSPPPHILILIAAFVGLGIAPKYTYPIYLLAGCAALGLLVYMFTTDTSNAVKSSGSLITITKQMTVEAKSIQDTLFFVAMIGLNLALVNCLPFIGLDGGKMTVRLLASIFPHRGRRAIHIFGWITIIPLLALVLLALGGDAVTLFKSIFHHWLKS